MPTTPEKWTGMSKSEKRVSIIKNLKKGIYEGLAPTDVIKAVKGEEYSKPGAALDVVTAIPALKAFKFLKNKTTKVISDKIIKKLRTVIDKNKKITKNITKNQEGVGAGGNKKNQITRNEKDLKKLGDEKTKLEKKVETTPKNVKTKVDTIANTAAGGIIAGSIIHQVGEDEKKKEAPPPKKIIILPKKPTPDKYTVKKGDTLWKIVKDKYKLTDDKEIGRLVNKITETQKNAKLSSKLKKDRESDSIKGDFINPGDVIILPRYTQSDKIKAHLLKRKI